MTQNNNWISATVGDTGMIISCQENTSTTIRKAEITITQDSSGEKEILNVTQNGREGSTEVVRTVELEISGEAISGGSVTFNFLVPFNSVIGNDVTQSNDKKAVTVSMNSESKNYSFQIKSDEVPTVTKLEWEITSESGELVNLFANNVNLAKNEKLRDFYTNRLLLSKSTTNIKFEIKKEEYVTLKVSYQTLPSISSVTSVQLIFASDVEIIEPSTASTAVTQNGQFKRNFTVRFSGTTNKDEIVKYKYKNEDVTSREITRYEFKTEATCDSGKSLVLSIYISGRGTASITHERVIEPQKAEDSDKEIYSFTVSFTSEDINIDTGKNPKIEIKILNNEENVEQKIWQENSAINLSGNYTEDELTMLSCILANSSVKDYPRIINSGILKNSDIQAAQQMYNAYIQHSTEGGIQEGGGATVNP